MTGFLDDSIGDPNEQDHPKVTVPLFPAVSVVFLAAGSLTCFVLAS
jgi:hypothetical protein